MAKDETYLGDGLYASFDGWMIQLRAPRPFGDHVVFLEPASAACLRAICEGTNTGENVMMSDLNDLNIPNILKLADMLEANAVNKKGMKFDIEVIGCSKSTKPTLSCGTTGCAMGLAAISGEFYRLTAKTIPSIAFDGEYEIRCFVGRQYMLYTDAAMEIFGVSIDEAMMLFSPNHYAQGFKSGAKGEFEVARRLRWLAAHGNLDLYGKLHKGTGLY